MARRLALSTIENQIADYLFLLSRLSILERYPKEILWNRAVRKTAKFLRHKALIQLDENEDSSIVKNLFSSMTYIMVLQ